MAEDEEKSQARPSTTRCHTDKQSVWWG